MDMSHMAMADMDMVFFKDHKSALFGSAWSPSSQGGYAGTCIFVILLAIVSRLLAVYRTYLERRWHDAAVNRRYIRVAGEADHEKARNESEREGLATLTARGMDESVRIITSKQFGMNAQPWRLSVDLPRAGIYTVQAGVGYLL